MVRWLSATSSPVLLVGLLGLVSFGLQARRLLLSDFPSLLVWMQDDSFYYLQPAWMLKETGRFTFDGEAPTYGFQPLWMLLLTGLSYATTDKVAFARASLVLGALLYCATALLLYRLSTRWWGGWRAAVAPGLWLTSPGLMATYTTGKENALYALLLVGLLLLTYRRLQSNRGFLASVAYGGLCGLLLLARVNSLMVVLVLAMALAIFGWGTWRDRLQHTALTVVGMAVVLIPWATYSATALGSVFPNSGSAKLFSAKAALALYLSARIPFLPLDGLASLLSPEERLLLGVPDQLALPSASLTLDYLVRQVPLIAFAPFVNGLLVSLPHSVQNLLRLPYTLVVAGLLVSIAWGLMARARMVRSTSPRWARGLRSHLPPVALFFFAIANGSVNSLLLPEYLRYGTWYAVPETLSLVLLTSYLGLLGFDTIARTMHPRPATLAVLGLILLSYPILSFFRYLAPQPYSMRAEYEHEAWEAHFWMNENIPRGTRVGSWSSGQLGYFADGPIVVNLDGLANSPGFVATVLPHDSLYYYGLTSRNELWSYLQARGIRYVADADHEARLGVSSFFRRIPVESYKVVYRGYHPIDWKEREGPRRFVILELRY